MQSLRRFLSPGWILGLLAVVAFAWACFALLAPWQLGKSDDLDARNSRLAESVQSDPAPLQDVVDGPGDFVERQWRLVTSEGRWQPDSEALLRLRAVDGEPVYHVLTVFALEDGREILINRGHVPVGENNTAPDYPEAPAGTVEITSRVRAAEAGQAEPVEVDGYQAVRVIDPVVLGDTFGHDLVSAGYLQLTGDQPGSLTPAPIPAIESGPYLSYGLQWLAFGVLAPLALLYFAYSELRARRRDEAGQAGTGPARPGGPDDGTGDGSASTNDETDAQGARERALLDRYGRRDDAEQRRAYRRADRLRS